MSGSSCSLVRHLYKLWKRDNDVLHYPNIISMGCTIGDWNCWFLENSCNCVMCTWCNYCHNLRYLTVCTDQFRVFLIQLWISGNAAQSCENALVLTKLVFFSFFFFRQNPRANVVLSSKKKRKLMKGRMIADREANGMLG